MAVRAPAFAEGLDWLNSEPLVISELRGRYILLDFFTFGCINCLNNLRTVKALHASYGRDLCVIGVHTGKFAHEKELDALKAALRREDITFAVVNDPEHLIADAYAAKGWPTTILVDNRGYIVHHASGEQRVPEWRGRFSSCGLQASGEKSHKDEKVKKLAFVQKVCAAPEFLAVANTHDNEVWISGYDGCVSAVIEGLQHPMGMAYSDGKLYICESGASRIVRYDLESKEKETLIEEVRNPYDIALDNKRLIVAAAGSHQMLIYDRDTLELKEAYGNRFEALRDGRAEACQMAQPSGVALMDDVLWFVDAESSSLRKIENGEVATLIGEGLFTYGDSNEEEILLQHPQGVCAGIVGDGCGGGRLFIADTFNNKVKAYYPDDNSMMTLLDGLDEPGGIAKKGCELYIANTNAHEIIVFDLSKMEKRVMTFH
jgi:thiol-disulfide isomerase/thioredoxin